jgi:Protein of unknown function (DUF2924)
METGKPFKKDERMEESLLAAIVELGRLNAAALKIRYRELFGEDSRSSNKQFLVRRIAWRLQAQAEGDLSERARRRIAEIADDKDFRTRAPVGFLGRPEPAAASFHGAHNDLRLPPPGTEIRRRFGNRDIVVKVLSKGFEYEHKQYRSLSAIAREVTGTRWNGLLFFGLTERRSA